jgi:hypothetical protein
MQPREEENSSTTQILMRRFIPNASNLSLEEEEKVMAAAAVIRLLRSKERRKLHENIFKQPPNSGFIPIIIPESYKELEIKLNKLRPEIVSNRKIVGKYIHHYTSFDNLASIIGMSHFYGRDILYNKEVKYDQNVYCSKDGENGDSKVICFCPGLVDRGAYIIDNTVGGWIKTNRCRLKFSIDDEHINKFGKYNQFFKLSDFNVAWFRRISLDNLTIEIISNFDIQFILNDQIEIVHYDKNERIFYGNSYAFNQYCFNQLILLISKIKNEQFKHELYSHLNNLSEGQLKKLIIVFAQQLTTYAEHNFNGSIPLQAMRIKEILVIGDKKILYDLSKLANDEYMAVLQEFKNKNYDDPKIVSLIKNLKDEETILLRTNYGKDIFGDYKINLSTIDEVKLTTPEYCETRIGLDHSIF